MEYKRYDIVQADLGSFDEDFVQSGIRPVIIIQNNIGNLHSPTTIIMPLSTKTFKNPNQPTHTLIKKSKENGLLRDSMVLGEQMRVISSSRIIKKIGEITDKKEKKAIRRVYDASFGDE